LELIETALKRAARRRRWERALRGLWQGLLCGGLVWLLVEGVYKLFPIPHWSLTAAALAGGAIVLIGLIVGVWRKASLIETARWVDGKKHLQERLSTALEFSDSSAPGSWTDLSVKDSPPHAREVARRTLWSFRLP